MRCCAVDGSSNYLNWLLILSDWTEYQSRKSAFRRLKIIQIEIATYWCTQTKILSYYCNVSTAWARSPWELYWLSFPLLPSSRTKWAKHLPLNAFTFLAESAEAQSLQMFLRDNYTSSPLLLLQEFNGKTKITRLWRPEHKLIWVELWSRFSSRVGLSVIHARFGGFWWPEAFLLLLSRRRQVKAGDKKTSALYIWAVNGYRCTVQTNRWRTLWPNTSGPEKEVDECVG